MRLFLEMTLGIDPDLQYIEFYFDSLDTLQTLNSNSSTRDWPQFLLQKPLNNIAAIKVLEAQIPFTWYVFNTLNNKFTLTEDIGSPVTITIPIGNYSSTSLAAILSSILTSGSPNGRTYTVTFSGASSTQPNLGKFTFTSSSASVFTFTFAGSEGNIDPAILLGFRGSVPFNSTVGGVLVAPNVANVTGPNYLYLKSNRMGSLFNTYLPQGADKLGSSISEIAKIPVNVQPNGVIYWQDPAPEIWFDMENMNNLADIDFYFTLGNTSAQTPLEFNGSSFSLKMGILINKSSHNQNQSGLAHQQRVVLRNVPL